MKRSAKAFCVSAACFAAVCLSTSISAAADDVKPLVPGSHGVTYPQLLHAPLPVYPQNSSRASIHATVRMSYVVLASGEVDQVKVEESSVGGEAVETKSPGDLAVVTAEFETVAGRALRARRYAPAMKDARPVAVRMELVYEFSPEERLALSRWRQVEVGLRALATADLIPEDANVAGADDVSIPVAIKQRAPIQPHGARVRGLRSRVLLLLLVDEEGRVETIPLVRAEIDDYMFADAAEAAVRRWRFTPAEKDGAPVAAYHWLQLTIPIDPTSS